MALRNRCHEFLTEFPTTTRIWQQRVETVSKETKQNCSDDFLIGFIWSKYFFNSKTSHLKIAITFHQIYIVSVFFVVLFFAGSFRVSLVIEIGGPWFWESPQHSHSTTLITSLQTFNDVTSSLACRLVQISLLKFNFQTRNFPPPQSDFFHFHVNYMKMKEIGLGGWGGVPGTPFRSPTD